MRLLHTLPWIEKEDNMIQNLSQFKKAMKEGKRFQIIEHFNFPERNGEIRKPNVVQTNGMYTILPENPDNELNKANKGRGSWIAFGKASDYTFCNGLIQQNFRSQPIWTLRVLED